MEVEDINCHYSPLNSNRTFNKSSPLLGCSAGLWPGALCWAGGDPGGHVRLSTWRARPARDDGAQPGECQTWACSAQSSYSGCSSVLLVSGGHSLGLSNVFLQFSATEAPTPSTSLPYSARRFTSTATPTFPMTRLCPTWSSGRRGAVTRPYSSGN